MARDAVQPNRRATYEDLLRVPDTKVAEIVDGELIVSPRPASPHSFAASGMAAALLPAFHGTEAPAGPGGWWILQEPELHFADDVLVPDLAAWRRERMPVVPDTAASTLAPDWVCEIVSPSTARLDRVGKMPCYARNGVARLWLVDPLARTLESVELVGDRWTVVACHAGDDSVRIEPFTGAEIRLDRWWLPD
jgi:Uma2 family endonuclease